MNPTPKKILLIEDDKFISDLYARQLSNAGFTVVVANDGTTGLQHLTSDTFDLLLLDIMLPGMNGLEVLEAFRTKNPQIVLPVLMLTNLGQDAVIKKGFDLGAAGYLIKASYTPAQIVEEAKKALVGQQAGSPNPNMTPNSPASSEPAPIPSVEQSLPSQNAIPTNPQPLPQAPAQTAEPTTPVQTPPQITQQ